MARVHHQPKEGSVFDDGNHQLSFSRQLCIAALHADERKALILVIKSAQTNSTAPACCSFTAQPFNQAKASSED